MQAEQYYPCFHSYVTLGGDFLLHGRTGNRYALNNEARSLVEAIDGSSPLSELVDRFGSAAEGIIRYLYNEQLLLLSKTPRSDDALREYQLHTANIEVTYACDLGCLYCFNNSGRALADELGSAEWIRALELLKQVGVSVVSLTGGEPLTKEGIWDILEYAVENFKVCLVTNGWHLASVLSANTHTDLLRKLWLVDVSFDSLNPSLHDALRKYGSHARALRSILLLRSLDVAVEISPVHHILNYHEEELGRFAEALGATVSYSGLECRGRAKEHHLKYLVPPQYDRIRQRYKQSDSVTCPALYGELTLQPNGYFKPCLQPPSSFREVSTEFVQSFHVFELEAKRPSDIPFLQLLKVSYTKCPNSECRYFDEICGLCLVLRSRHKKAGSCKVAHVA